MTAPFEVDFSTLPLNLRYKLLAALVAPRPIALVTTVGKDGVVNAAPFSFFNVFSEDPALVVLGLQSRPDGTPKDTLKHIRETGVFVVNLVDEAMAERMNNLFHRLSVRRQRNRGRRIHDPAGSRRCGSAYRRGAGYSGVPPLYDPGSQSSAPSLHRQRGSSACTRGHHRRRATARKPRRLQADRAAIRQSVCAPREKFVLKRQSFTEWDAENGVDAAADRAETKPYRHAAKDAASNSPRTR